MSKLALLITVLISSVYAQSYVQGASICLDNFANNTVSLSMLNAANSLASNIARVSAGNSTCENLATFIT